VRENIVIFYHGYNIRSPKNHSILMLLESLLEANFSIDENGIRVTSVSPKSAEMFWQFGVVLGKLVPQGGKFLVSAELAACDPKILSRFIEGLRLAGTTVVDLGVLPRPMVYYAARRIHADGLAMITTSDSLGLKWQIGEAVPDSRQVETLKNLLLEINSVKPSKSQGRKVRFWDVTYDYVDWLQETWFDSAAKKMHIVLEACGGVWTGRARRYLQAVFPQIVFSEVSDEHNQFHAIAEEVDRMRAELGFILGPGGGQLTVVDGYGIPYTAEELNGLLLESFGDSLHSEIFLHDAQCSPRILSKAADYGATVREIPSDESSFRREIMKTSAIFGADSTGHHYFRATCGNNDALFTACWLLDFLAHSNQTLVQHRKSSATPVGGN